MSAAAGRVAVVTGSSRGIGRATARRLAADGAAVAVNYVSDAAAAEAVVAEIVDAGGEAFAARADVSDLGQIRDLFDLVEKRYGGVDVVVANVGAFVYKPVVDITEEEFDRVFAVNAKGTFFVLQEGARRVRDGGRLIAVSTGGTVSPGPQGAVYAGSKAAAERFTAALAHELGARGITANTVAPGVTRTDGLVVPDQVRQHLVSQTPLGRLGEPGDIAAVIGFLASPDGAWITGQTVRAGGGMF